MASDFRPVNSQLAGPSETLPLSSGKTLHPKSSRSLFGQVMQLLSLLLSPNLKVVATNSTNPRKKQQDHAPLASCWEYSSRVLKVKTMLFTTWAHPQNSPNSDDPHDSFWCHERNLKRRWVRWVWFEGVWNLTCSPGWIMCGYAAGVESGNASPSHGNPSRLYRSCSATNTFLNRGALGRRSKTSDKKECESLEWQDQIWFQCWCLSTKCHNDAVDSSSSLTRLVFLTSCRKGSRQSIAASAHWPSWCKAARRSCLLPD